MTISCECSTITGSLETAKLSYNAEEEYMRLLDDIIALGDDSPDYIHSLIAIRARAIRCQ